MSDEVAIYSASTYIPEHSGVPALPVTVFAGRQQLRVGEGQLIGFSNWMNLSRTFDVIHAHSDKLGTISTLGRPWRWSLRRWVAFEVTTSGRNLMGRFTVGVPIALAQEGIGHFFSREL